MQIEAPVASKHLSTMPHASHHAHRDPPHPRAPGPAGGRELLTAEEVAHLLGMGVDWVWAQTRAGNIPSITLGSYRRYRRQSIDQWLQELESRPPSAQSMRSLAQEAARISRRHTRRA